MRRFLVWGGFLYFDTEQNLLRVNGLSFEHSSRRWADESLAAVLVEIRDEQLF